MARSGQLARNPARNTDRRMVNEIGDITLTIPRKWCAELQNSELAY